MEDLEKEVESIIFDLIDSEDLKINDSDEIEYTQKWLNEWLMSWILDGYTTKEVMKVLEYFENFYYEDERETWDTVYYEDCNGGIDWYEENERIETFIVETKKVGWYGQDVWTFKSPKWLKTYKERNKERAKRVWGFNNF